MTVVLQAAAQAFADATAKPPFLDDLQAGPIAEPDVQEEFLRAALHGSD